MNINTSDKHSLYDYSLWFKIARYTEVLTSDAIVMAKKWHKFQQELDYNDPRPPYYLYILHILRALDNYAESLTERARGCNN
ncbi:hypothetical protein KPL37_15995 [Clostridium frigoris]|uniref:Uncharacterized protein n=1 Tax=Clostridium frigoris TaxID=205327 RepID=A0ABS6BX88_9CLOT|nr:hypothetical protein [Clostridium frigoris]MBU3161222.1 hypothetical protein [Clostridium frigoris]